MISFSVLKRFSIFDISCSSQWMIAGAGDPLPEPNSFLHGESPSSGQSWMSQGTIAFDKLKLTNNR